MFQWLIENLGKVGLSVAGRTALGGALLLVAVLLLGVEEATRLLNWLSSNLPSPLQLEPPSP